MKILFAASEAAPFFKIGGLADVVTGLSKTLKDLKCDVRIIIPKYETIETGRYNFSFLTKFAFGGKEIGIWRGFLNKVPVYLLENEEYLGRGNAYSSIFDFGGIKRFLFFSGAVLKIFPKIGWFPNILHCHDWHTAILPALAKLQVKAESQKLKTLLTIHNLETQGKWRAKEVFDFLNLAGNETENLKIRGGDGDFNILQQGILSADILNTVSPNYRNEILTKKYDTGLEKDLLSRKRDFYGIINGVDYDLFNPAKDAFIKINYSLENPELKKENKVELQKILNLPADPKNPVLAFIGRLASQKGLDLIEKIIPDLISLGSQFVVLGAGSKNYEEMLFQYSKKYPKDISANIKFDPILAQKIYAGADIFLIPSLFEPCGLVQIIAQRYGAIPVARKTGGLANTIEDKKTGFLFEEYKPAALLETIKICLGVFYDKGRWEKMIRRAMVKDFSWENSAQKYLKLYQKLAK